jgi:hypothetical protein
MTGSLSSAPLAGAKAANAVALAGGYGRSSPRIQTSSVWVTAGQARVPAARLGFRRGPVTADAHVHPGRYHLTGSIP